MPYLWARRCSCSFSNWSRRNNPREREREREREKERHSGSGIRSEFARHSLNFPLYRFSSPYLLPVGLRQSSNTIWRIRVAIMKRLNDSSFQMRISLPGIYTRTRNLSGILGEFLGLQSSSSAFELCAHTSFDPALIDKGFRLPLESTSWKQFYETAGIECVRDSFARRRGGNGRDACAP